MKDFGISGSGIEQLIRQYDGHPLALKMACEMIQDFHSGKISEFLNGTVFMGDVMYKILDKQWYYLSDTEKNVIKYLANAAEPKLMSQFFQQFPYISQAECKEAIYKLLQRLIITKEDRPEAQALFFLNPLIKKYTKKRCK